MFRIIPILFTLLCGCTSLAVQINPTSAPSVNASYSTAAATTYANDTSARVIKFDVANFDSNSAYSVSTGQFTCPSKGKYQFAINVMVDSIAWTAGNFARLELWKNGAQYAIFWRAAAWVTRSDYTPLGGALLAPCSAVTDYFEYRLATNCSGGAVALIANSVYNTISIARVGD